MTSPTSMTQSAAQQPQSDLVKRMRERSRYCDREIGFLYDEAADRIEALEAAAAQPSERALSDDIDRLVGVLAEVKYRLGVVAEGCLRPWKDHHSSLELSLSDIRHEMQECIPFIADHIHQTKPPHEHSSPAAAQPSREAALVKALEPFARLGAVLQVVNEMRVVRQEYWGELRADGYHGPNMGQLLEKTSQRVTTEDFIAAALALAAYDTPAKPDPLRQRDSVASAGREEAGK